MGKMIASGPGGASASQDQEAIKDDAAARSVCLLVKTYQAQPISVSCVFPRRRLLSSSDSSSHEKRYPPLPDRTPLQAER